MTTCPSAEKAQAIARALVAESLASCVNVIPRVESIYLWEGSIQTEPEYLLLIKSMVNKFPDIEQRIKALHSYELPEIIAVPIIAGSPEYLAWLGSPEKS